MKLTAGYNFREITRCLRNPRRGKSRITFVIQLHMEKGI